MAETTDKAEREFLGWCRPPLAHAAGWLVRRFADDRLLDLSDVVLVTPGARAGRTLLATLVEEAEAAALELLPPRLCTPGNLALELCEFGQPLADSLACRLAWVEALRGMSPDDLAPLLKHPPDAKDALAWHGYAAVCQRLHVDLCAGGLLFEDVPQRVVSRPWFDDGERWRIAAQAQAAYTKQLEQWGLADPDLARMTAAAEPEPIALDAVLIGVAELPPVLRLLLARCRSRAALIFAPPTLSDGFDALGCVEVKFWRDRHTPLEERDIFFADDVHDQANLVLALLAELEPPRTVDEITIGVADTSAEATIAGRLELQAGLPVHRASGRPIAQSAPYRLLVAAAEYLEDLRYSAFAALVRQADVEALGKRLAREAGQPAQALSWAEALDAYQGQCLPTRVDGEWRGAAGRDVQAALAEAHRAVRVMLGDLDDRLADGSPPRRGQAEWAGSLGAMLQRVYEQRTASRSVPAERRLIEALEHIGAALDEWQRLGRRASGQLPACTAAEALRLLADELADVALTDEPDPCALEMLGWLELALDGAPVAIVTGMNHGCVPATVTHDAMLPGTLRAALGLPDGDLRLARDAYLLTLLAETRQRLVLISGKRTQRGDPLLPSPLLFRSPTIAVPELVLRYTGKRPHRPMVRAASALRPGALDRFEVPPLVRPATVEEMSVTSFSTYLASPYLFYLRHVMGLCEADDSGVEMDALAFGSLVHRVLEDFANSDVKTSSTTDEIAAYLGDTLADRARRLYGPEPGMAVRLQLNFAQWRLERFAVWQARRRAEGWLIEQEPEWKPTGGSVVFAAGDVSIQLRGRIDRIERHEDTGRLAILDYKTSEDAKSPERAHMRRGEWCDLQLPLYRHLAAELLQGEEPALGYVCISSAEKGTELLEAERDAAALAEADATAREVVRAVKAGEFDEVGELEYENGALATICRLARLALVQLDETGGEM